MWIAWLAPLRIESLFSSISAASWPNRPAALPAMGGAGTSASVRGCERSGSFAGNRLQGAERTKLGGSCSKPAGGGEVLEVGLVRPEPRNWSFPIHTSSLKNRFYTIASACAVASGLKRETPVR
jgi:hypothetical protein